MLELSAVNAAIIIMLHEVNALELNGKIKVLSRETNYKKNHMEILQQKVHHLILK